MDFRFGKREGEKVRKSWEGGRPRDFIQGLGESDPQLSSSREERKRHSPPLILSFAPPEGPLATAAFSNTLSTAVRACGDSGGAAAGIVEGRRLERRSHGATASSSAMICCVWLLLKETSEENNRRLSIKTFCFLLVSSFPPYGSLSSSWLRHVGDLVRSFDYRLADTTTRSQSPVAGTKEKKARSCSFSLCVVARRPFRRRQRTSTSHMATWCVTNCLFSPWMGGIGGLI